MIKSNHTISTKLTNQARRLIKTRNKGLWQLKQPGLVCSQPILERKWNRPSTNQIIGSANLWLEKK